MNGREEEYLPAPERTAPLLAVSSLPADRARLREILSQENWKLHEASDCRRALPSLRDHSVPVLLCDRDYADVDRGDLLTATERSPAPPNAEPCCVLCPCRRVALAEGWEIWVVSTCR
jgi:PleD family two-component response regulator